MESVSSLAVILAPTRELCVQIEEVAQQLCRRFVWDRAGAVHWRGEPREGEGAPAQGAGHCDRDTWQAAGPSAQHLLVRLARLRWLVLDGG
ncbi:unnamed protein product [Closterium sp. NIES-64]|nr:unnamed protein product [Closterium sp. NIES-64]